MPFARAYFTLPFCVIAKKKKKTAHAYVIRQKPAHTQKDTELRSFQLSGFVSTVRLNMGTRSVEHTLVSQCVCVCFIFYFSYRLRFKRGVVHFSH